MNRWFAAGKRSRVQECYNSLTRNENDHRRIYYSLVQPSQAIASQETPNTAAISIHVCWWSDIYETTLAKHYVAQHFSQTVQRTLA